MKKSSKIPLIAAMVISLAAVGWWAVINASIVYHLLMQTHKSVENAIPASTYNPAHYLSFTGNKSYAVIPENQSLNTELFTVSFWARADASKHNNFERPIQMLRWLPTEGDLSIPYGWTFDTGNISKIGNDKLYFKVGNTAGNLVGTEDLSLQTDSWSHIVGVFDGNTLRLYKNGVSVSKFPFNASYSLPTSPIPILIATSFMPDHYWRGDLSDIQLYNRPLTQAEITSIYDGQGNGPKIPGLIGQWKLDEGTGNVIHDSSGSGHDGETYGATWE